MEGLTTDFSRFGYVELDQAGTLLKEYSNNPHILDGDNIQIFFNLNSGCVFISDEDFNVAMMNGDKLELFYFCPYCGHEGFLEDMKHKPEDQDCINYMEQIGVEDIDTE